MPRPTIKTNTTMDNTILSRQGAWQAATVRVSSLDVTAGTDGRKVVKAGTFLGTAETGVGVLAGGAKAKPVNGAATEGLAMNTVDVTDGDMEVAMLFMGTVGLDRIPAAPTADAIEALNRITFTKD